GLRNAALREKRQPGVAGLEGISQHPTLPVRSQMADMTHVPVLADEVMAALALQPGDVVLDATLGLGGHAQLLLRAIGPTGTLLGIERTEEGLNAARKNLARYRSQTSLVRADFRHLDAVVRDR